MAKMPRQKPGRSKQNYATPDNFIDAVKRKLMIDNFSHDFAADETNRRALTYFSESNNAFDHLNWEIYCNLDKWGWLNPPFANIGKWARRCLQTKHAAGHIVMLVPAAVGSNWFRDYVHDQCRVLFLNGRIHFDRDNPTWGYPKDCILILFSNRYLPGYEVWTWK
jgi:phage N-6-adenine-methyltransferase